ncbi:MAG TPA: flagellar export chaperone FlgN [Anaerohalosphaeraceae bacterium]|nr:flagellar export chaperone FlgN [Anaerohalosphaeraceae bacterium]HRT49465.1 flagellar export chaperone FlgN [Anaerohalosphaeraceae bacterium]HRT85371.1 flagellar export chaperone FlgN [Anaerohalosphaeraceae bacterium]
MRGLERMHTADALEDYIKQLLGVLDEDAAHIQRTLEQLNALRAAIIKREEAALQELLDAVGEEGRHYRQVEMRRQRICDLIAGFTDGRRPINLSALCEMTDGPLREQIRTRQTELKKLVETLRMEHTCTMILLRECSRLNKMLLKGMLGRGETVTYTARGSETWQTQNDMVNLRL